MNHYSYYFVYDVCGSHFAGHHNRAGQPIYIGNGRVKFFECVALDILDADRQLAAFCEVKKINWNERPFAQVAVDISLHQGKIKGLARVL